MQEKDVTAWLTKLEGESEVLLDRTVMGRQSDIEQLRLASQRSSELPTPPHVEHGDERRTSDLQQSEPTPADASDRCIEDKALNASSGQQSEPTPADASDRCIEDKALNASSGQQSEPTPADASDDALDAQTRLVQRADLPDEALAMMDKAAPPDSGASRLEELEGERDLLLDRTVMGRQSDIEQLRLASQRKSELPTPPHAEHRDDQHASGLQHGEPTPADAPDDALDAQTRVLQRAHLSDEVLAMIGNAARPVDSASGANRADQTEQPEPAATAKPEPTEPTEAVSGLAVEEEDIAEWLRKIEDESEVLLDRAIMGRRSDIEQLRLASQRRPEPPTLPGVESDANGPPRRKPAPMTALPRLPVQADLSDEVTILRRHNDVARQFEPAATVKPEQLDPTVPSLKRTTPAASEEPADERQAASAVAGSENDLGTEATVMSARGRRRYRRGLWIALGLCVAASAALFWAGHARPAPTQHVEAPLGR